MYCPECRSKGTYPWQHASGCVEGLRQRLRWYERGLPIVILIVGVETLPLAKAFALR
jgi:hypothetical protein